MGRAFPHQESDARTRDKVKGVRWRRVCRPESPVESFPARVSPSVRSRSNSTYGIIRPRSFALPLTLCPQLGRERVRTTVDVERRVSLRRRIRVGRWNSFREADEDGARGRRRRRRNGAVFRAQRGLKKWETRRGERVGERAVL